MQPGLSRLRPADRLDEDFGSLFRPQTGDK
jgi:hypothetical protein